MREVRKMPRKSIFAVAAFAVIAIAAIIIIGGLR